MAGVSHAIPSAVPVPLARSIRVSVPAKLVSDTRSHATYSRVGLIVSCWRHPVDPNVGAPSAPRGIWVADGCQARGLEESSTIPVWAIRDEPLQVTRVEEVYPARADGHYRARQPDQANRSPFDVAIAEELLEADGVLSTPLIFEDIQNVVLWSAPKRVENLARPEGLMVFNHSDPSTNAPVIVELNPGRQFDRVVGRGELTGTPGSGYFIRTSTPIGRRVGSAALAPARSERTVPWMAARPPAPC
jgi:hypothetical protein